MTPDINFESLSHNLFSIHESSINSEHDPDINFYQDISSLETHYCSPNDFKNNFQSFLKDSFSVLHLNIRSMNKNVESFKEFYSKIKFKFSINFLDFETNKNLQDFLNLMFRYNMISLTNKPTRVTKHSANAIDHIITNSVTGHNDFKSAIIKTDL